MSCLSYPSTAELRAERISQSKRSNLPAAHFPSSSGCSLTYFYLWNRKLAASPKKRSFLRAQTSEHTKDSIGKKLGSRRVCPLFFLGMRQRGGAPNHNRSRDRIDRR
jgi:hypothetical protein